MNSSCFKIIFLFLLCINVFYIIIYFQTDNDKHPRAFFNKNLTSLCPCVKDIVSIQTIKDYVKIDVLDTGRNKVLLSYQIHFEDYKRIQLTCDPYKVLRRGFDQKIISFSLYGKDSFYYRLVKANVARAFNFYPGWTARIYHDKSIEPGFICEIECTKTGNVDFCDITNMPGELNFNYMLPMTWRWLPIGDRFVNLFISRDTDSCIFDREVFAVNEWLNSDTLFHIMRGKMLRIFKLEYIFLNY